MIRKLLIANRAEIAVRVIRTARRMGIATVGVASEADRGSLHASLADEMVDLGPSAAGESYLRIDKLIAAAKATGADAIHPGYGFLSERPELSRACRDEGIVFVGPPPEAMERLGSKISAKKLAVEAGVPIVPGFFDPGASDEQLIEAASGLGYPVMLKAAAGGGGRGMRVVRAPDEMPGLLSVARDEALKAFGDGEMMVEKLIERPRHIETQIIADSHGTVAPLFERECSIQRRHQKLIEESPTPLWSEDASMWDSMRAAAQRLARDAGYVGAGTVEFIVDPAGSEFYFLEVNARLQVEHPVTEAITGLDLVEWQLRVASGEPLRFDPRLIEGDRSALKGHAIEARIVAENPEQEFAPSSGKIRAWDEPRGPGIRVDSGYAQGLEVPRFYDSLAAKVIAHGETREVAIGRLAQALADFHVLGIRTNIGYLLDVLASAEFSAGHLDTGLLGREFAHWSVGEPPAELGAILKAARGGSPHGEQEEERGAWASLDGFRNG